MTRNKYDYATVNLNSLCNSADPTQPMDPIDGLVRFRKKISYSLNVSVCPAVVLFCCCCCFK